MGLLTAIFIPPRPNSASHSISTQSCAQNIGKNLCAGNFRWNDEHLLYALLWLAYQTSHIN